MVRSIVATAVFASLAFAAQANEGADLSMKSRASASASAASASSGASSGRQNEAPFTYGRDPMPQLILLEAQERRLGPKGSCEFTARDLCYDIADGRIVYRPARQYMPTFNGLTPENVTLRSNRIVFKYSFK